jgi:large subunit ribosomal protein L21
MYAIIEEGGGQRKVEKDEIVLIDLTNEGVAKAGDKISFDKVLVVGTAGGDAKIGQPYVKGASVQAEITQPVVKGEKLYIQKFKEKTTFKKRTGHRQRYTEVKIIAING